MCTAITLWIRNCGYNKEMEIFAVLLLHIQIRSVKVCWAVIIWASKQFAQPTCLLPFTYLLPPALLPAIQYRYDLFLNLKSFFSLLLCTSHTNVLIYKPHGELISITKIQSSLCVWPKKVHFKPNSYSFLTLKLINFLVQTLQCAETLVFYSDVTLMPHDGRWR